MSDQSLVDLVAPRILVMGVGSSGARAVADMAKLNPDLNTVSIDTDGKVLEALPTAKSIQVGHAVTHGLSAGGDVELGRLSIEKDSSDVRKQLRQSDLLVIVAGLGGGTGSGAVPVITRLAHETGTLVLCLVSLPFAFEGKKVMRIADESVKRIRTHADAIVRINNETLVDRSDADMPVEAAFSRSYSVIKDGVFAIGRMLGKNGICGLDFACVHTMLRNCDGFCHFASAEASGPDRDTVVTNEILNHKLLKGGKVLGGSSGIIIGLTGGDDLKMREVEAIMNRIKEELAEDVWLNFGVVIDPEFEGRLSVITLVAEQWREPLVDDSTRQMGFSDVRRKLGQQGELALEVTGKGQFASLDPTIYDHQDIDVPTYIRRDIKLPR